MINNEFLLRDRRHGILIRRFFRKADGAIFNCGCKGTDYFPNHKIFSGKKLIQRVICSTSTSSWRKTEADSRNFSADSVVR